MSELIQSLLRLIDLYGDIPVEVDAYDDTDEEVLLMPDVRVRKLVGRGYVALLS